MTDVTAICSAMAQGDPDLASQLLPLVYDELRGLAARRLAREPPGQTLEATALVHEAYLRLVGGAPEGAWDGRAHFFAAAAEAMRRILVENARRKGRLKRGGGLAREVVELSAVPEPATPPDDELLSIDAALDRLATVDSRAAELVKLRYFAGFTIVQSAEIRGHRRRHA
jgi:RNA polymerase sigma factor (TIGR02999 family)